MSSKTLLIIVHDFAPLGGGSVMRTVKFAKYLPEFGWRPLILTLEERYYPAQFIDETLARDLPPNLPIQRTPSLKPEARTRARVIAGSTAASRKGRTFHPAVLARKAKRWLEQRVLLPKDEGYLWYPYALPALRRILRAHQVDAVLTTSPPNNVHWLGWAAARWGGIPWVVDFRDGWAGDKLFLSPSRARNAFERWQEKRILAAADRIICATQHCCADFAARYGAAADRKSSVLFNGFDPADFTESESASAPRVIKAPDGAAPLHIVHAGAAGGERRPVRPFLEAVRRVAQDSGAGSVPLAVDFYGSISLTDVETAASTPGINYRGFVPHTDAIQAMRAADVLLLIQGREAVDAVAGKVFEYAAAARPILTLTLPGALQRFIDANGWGRVANLEDPDAIAAALRELIQRKRAGTLDELRPTPESVRLYDRRESTRRLAALLDELAR